MKKLLIATVLTAVYGIGGVTFASTNDVQNNNEPIKMNLLVERNHDDVNNFQDKKCDMLLENQNNQMHRQDRMEHMQMNHQVDNMHRRDNDQSMRPEGQNHQMRQQCNNHQVSPQGRLLMVIDIMIMHHNNKLVKVHHKLHKTNHIL